jgi:RNA polymerase sigma-70 factor, ECF subfamily
MMDEHDFQHQIDSEILRLTRFKSRELAGKYGFASYDAEDIQQDLLLDYLKRSPAFDAYRCNKIGFARMLVRNGMSTLIQKHTAECRDYRACQISIDQSRNGQSLNRGETELTPSRFADPNTRTLEKKLTLRIDVERILARLPGPLVSLCVLLMVCDTTSEAASVAGISRATLYRRIHQVRAVFAQAGMDS